MAKKKTHEQFIKEFNEKNSNANNIEILGKYEGGKKPILCRCLIDNNIWSPRAEKLLINRGCPVCANNIKKTTEQFKKELKIKNPNIEVLGEYDGANTSIKCKCKVDGYEWYPIPHSLLQGCGCPKCANNIAKTTEEFKEELKKINPNIEILGEYTNNKTYIPCKCLKCSYEWETTPSILTNNKSGCPRCSESKGEKEIDKYLVQYNIKYEIQKDFEGLLGIGNGLLSYDFYLPTYNLLIEYQGEYHDGTVNKKMQSEEKLKKQQEHDRRKREYAEKNNIQLLEIWYWDFDKIENILIKELNL